MSSTNLSTFLFRSLAIICVILPFLSCTKKNPKTIVFDDWWNVDYLKNACQLQIQSGHGCLRSADEIAAEAENAIQVAFSSEPDCHDVRLLHFTAQMANAALKNPSARVTGYMKETANSEYWSLMLDLPGDNYSAGDWTMVKRAVVLKGDLSNLATAVRQVCAIAKGTGGSIGSGR